MIQPLSTLLHQPTDTFTYDLDQVNTTSALASLITPFM